MAATFGGGAEAQGAIAMFTQLGYAAGLALFGPLGDRLDRRRLIAALLVANILIYLLQQGGGDSFLAHYALWPLGPTHLAQLGDGNLVRIGFSWWQIVTYSFLHGSFTHIAFNMLALWMFGGPVENVLGARRAGLIAFQVTRPDEISRIVQNLSAR